MAFGEVREGAVRLGAEVEEVADERERAGPPGKVAASIGDGEEADEEVQGREDEEDDDAWCAEEEFHGRASSVACAATC
jgi:hypothetical protein